MTERKGTYTTRRFDDPLDKLLDRPIAYNPAFKSITGSTVAALFLSQAWYWTKRTSNEDGWFYKTQAEWEEETGLTRSEQETARKHLKELGIMEEDLRGIPAQLFYRLEKEKIYSLLGVQYAETPQTCLPEGVIQASGIVADINRNTENTTENTTSTTKSQIKIPDNSDIGWMMAGKVPSAEIAAVNAKIAARKTKGDLWEVLMGYNPLDWGSDKDLTALLNFLMDKTPEEMRTFAEWSKQKFSSLTPTKARQFPRMVIDVWPQAFTGLKPGSDKRPHAL